jgi:ABC-type multidrug transport system ATPase subunit
MQIKVEKFGKKFRNEWIFRNFNYNFNISQSYAVTGPNGSGKSTLLQAISGYIPNNEGTIQFLNGNSLEIPLENVFKHISITSPLLELIEEFTLAEFISFHASLKGFCENIGKNEFIEKIGLEKQIDKQIKYFSSGMKQKLKLGLCLYSNSEILLLDEPTTNLDENTKKWFLETVNQIKENKLIIVASNDPKEYIFANQLIDIQAFK